MCWIIPPVSRQTNDVAFTRGRFLHTMKYPLFVSCLLGLSGLARAYDAAFAEALDQPGREFAGSGWEVVTGVYSHDGIDSVANQTTDPHTLKTFSTEVT